jgi:hypothetical protein
MSFSYVLQTKLYRKPCVLFRFNIPQFMSRDTLSSVCLIPFADDSVLPHFPHPGFLSQENYLKVNESSLLKILMLQIKMKSNFTFSTSRPHFGFGTRLQIRSRCNTWIRIRIPNTDPDPPTEMNTVRIHMEPRSATLVLNSIFHNFRC